MLTQYDIVTITTLIFTCEEIEEFSNLLNVTQPVNGRAQIQA